MNVQPIHGIGPTSITNEQDNIEPNAATKSKQEEEKESALKKSIQNKKNKVIRRIRNVLKILRWFVTIKTSTRVASKINNNRKHIIQTNNRYQRRSFRIFQQP